MILTVIHHIKNPIIDQIFTYLHGTVISYISKSQQRLKISMILTFYFSQFIMAFASIMEERLSENHASSFCSLKSSILALVNYGRR